MSIHQRQDREFESELGLYRIKRNLSIKELCERANVSIGAYGNLNNGMTSPLFENRLNSDGTNIKPIVQRLANVLNVDVEDLFPRYFYRITNQDIDLHTVLEEVHPNLKMVNPEEQVIHMQLRESLIKCLMTLSPREERVIASVFGLKDPQMTFSDLAKVHNVTSTTIYQIFKKGMNRLRHSNSREILNPFKKPSRIIYENIQQV